MLIWAGFFHIPRSVQTLKLVSFHLCRLLLYIDLFSFLYTGTCERTEVWTFFALQIIRAINISATFFQKKIAEMISYWGWGFSIDFLHMASLLQDA